jgi:hypothetical protein
MKTIMRDFDVSGSKILKCILNKYDGMTWTNLSCPRQGKGAAHCDSNAEFYKMGNIS